MESTNYHNCIKALKSIKHKYPQLPSDFNKWYDEGGYEDDNLLDEFVENGIDECSFIEEIWDKKRIQTHDEAQEIFCKLHASLSPMIGPDPSRGFMQNMNPYNYSIVVELLNIYVDPKELCEYKSIKKKIMAQAPLMVLSKSKSSHSTACQDILTLEYIGYKNNNYPLLLHFVDSYIRCSMNEWILAEKPNNSNFTVSEFFSKHCNNKYFAEYFGNNEQKIGFICSAMASYQHRIVNPFQLMQPVFKIDNNKSSSAIKFSSYLFEIARVVRRCVTQPLHNWAQIIPIQLDFIIINKKMKSFKPKASECEGLNELFDFDDEDIKENKEDDDDDDDDDDYDDEINALPKDIGELLESTECEYEMYQIPSSGMLRCTEGIKRLSKDKRCTRSVFVVDRRTSDRCVYLFKPKDYNKFEENEQELIHCSLHHNSIKSMLPRKGQKRDYSACDSAKGQMFVISFHIMSKQEIRCYIFFQGQCFRFYGEDLINVLPLFFYNVEKAKRALLSCYSYDKKWRQSFNQFCETFVDDRFDAFYYGLTGKRPRIYKVTS